MSWVANLHYLVFSTDTKRQEEKKENGHHSGQPVDISIRVTSLWRIFYSVIFLSENYSGKCDDIFRVESSIGTSLCTTW